MYRKTISMSLDPDELISYKCRKVDIHLGHSRRQTQNSIMEVQRIKLNNHVFFFNSTSLWRIFPPKLVLPVTCVTPLTNVAIISSSSAMIIPPRIGKLLYRNILVYYDFYNITIINIFLPIWLLKQSFTHVRVSRDRSYLHSIDRHKGFYHYQRKHHDND